MQVKLYTLTTIPKHEITTSIFASKASRDDAYRAELEKIATEWGVDADDIKDLDAEGLQSYLDGEDMLDGYEFALGEDLVDVGIAEVVSEKAAA